MNSPSAHHHKTISVEESPLLDQQSALGVYLDALLMEPGVVLANSVPPIVIPESIPEISPQPSNTQENGIPDWAAQRFQVLLFEVAGIMLAVPRVKLTGVMPNEKGIASIPGHTALFPGVVSYQGAQSQVVDTARLIIPGTPSMTDPGHQAAHLVMIDQGRWALACDRVGDMVELEREDVKWRGGTGTRTWLAGTVIERMCALLDTDALVRQLNDNMA